MNINNKPQVTETTKENYVFLSHERTLRKISINELEETIISTEDISQEEITDLFTDQEER